MIVRPCGEQRYPLAARGRPAGSGAFLCDIHVLGDLCVKAPLPGAPLPKHPAISDRIGQHDGNTDHYPATLMNISERNCSAVGDPDAKADGSGTMRFATQRAMRSQISSCATITVATS